MLSKPCAGFLARFEGGLSLEDTVARYGCSPLCAVVSALASKALSQGRQLAPVQSWPHCCQ